jgi:hypothetical protein
VRRGWLRTSRHRPSHDEATAIQGTTFMSASRATGDEQQSRAALHGRAGAQSLRDLHDLVARAERLTRVGSR